MSTSLYRSDEIPEGEPVECDGIAWDRIPCVEYAATCSGALTQYLRPLAAAPFITSFYFSCGAPRPIGCNQGSASAVTPRNAGETLAVTLFGRGFKGLARCNAVTPPTRAICGHARACVPAIPAFQRFTVTTYQYLNGNKEIDRNVGETLGLPAFRAKLGRFGRG